VKDHEFTLILHGMSDFTDDDAESLHKAGCADATIIRTEGMVRMIFSRKAESSCEAKWSAIRDIRKSNIGVGHIQIS
jgi:hypothetical protein